MSPMCCKLAIIMEHYIIMLEYKYIYTVHLNFKSDSHEMWF